MSDKETLLRQITDQYLASRDFNGLALRRVAADATDKAALRELVESGLVSIVFGDLHPYPHIRAFPDESIAKTLEKMDRLWRRLKVSPFGKVSTRRPQRRVLTKRKRHPANAVDAGIAGSIVNFSRVVPSRSTRRFAPLDCHADRPGRSK